MYLTHSSTLSLWERHKQEELKRGWHSALQMSLTPNSIQISACLYLFAIQPEGKRAHQLWSFKWFKHCKCFSWSCWSFPLKTLNIFRHYRSNNPPMFSSPDSDAKKSLAPDSIHISACFHLPALYQCLDATHNKHFDSWWSITWHNYIRHVLQSHEQRVLWVI